LIIWKHEEDIDKSINDLIKTEYHIRTNVLELYQNKSEENKILITKKNIVKNYYDTLNKSCFIIVFVIQNENYYYWKSNKGILDLSIKFKRVNYNIERKNANQYAY